MVLWLCISWSNRIESSRVESSREAWSEHGSVVESKERDRGSSRVESSGYDAAGGRCSLGSLILRRNDGVGMRRTGALQEEIKGSRAGASKYEPRIRWIRWARASSYSLGRRTVNRYKRVSCWSIPTIFFSRSLINSPLSIDWNR